MLAKYLLFSNQRSILKSTIFKFSSAQKQNTDIITKVQISVYHKTLYNFLSKLNQQNVDLDQQYLDLTVKSADDQSQQIQEQLSSMRKQMTKLNIYSKLFVDLHKTIESLKACQEIRDDPREDKEMRKLAEEDHEIIMEQLDELQFEIEEAIVPQNEVDKKNCTIEVRQAAGGSESSLFAEDLLNMYKAFCQKKGLKCIQEEFMQDIAIGKGCKHALCKIIGEDAYKYFKFEAGVHKVQRVPETEKMGRMHSSTVTLVVMPEVPREFHIDEKDIRIDTYRASGAGGQHVNKTDSAVRATHIPTGIIATCQDERTQHSNKARALENLKQRLYQAFVERENSKDQKAKKDQMGTGNLGEKIRTYNWPSNRITDHRLGVSKFGIEEMLSGDLLEEFSDELLEQERSQKLKHIFGDSEKSSQ
ncbi:peptide chain release factor 1 [Stylonychia lemnae]|uniref:Peptide chain release factor 1 n=1 Tax=Stylonychia lemnae TaxID=5949 RepID=A0A077ZSC4_STYLE|nr:peptide chain release factor 1 [Stylonychia lemnae]|eukprot:CDW72772.1 peptide chain release factor 1 [Stylonychia lemnae]